METKNSTSTSSKKPIPNTRTYFDDLPEDALRRVIQWTGYGPRNDDWALSVHPLDALELFSAPGQLGYLSRHMISHLGTYIEYPEEENSGVIVAGKTKKDRRQFDSLVLAAAEGLRHVEIARIMGKKHQRFLRNCPNLRSVSLVDNTMKHPRPFPIGYIARSTGGTLEALHIKANELSQSDMTDIQSHCRNLRSLSLDMTSMCPWQKSFWEAVAPGLEKLCLNAQDVQDVYNLAEIAQCTLNLKILHFSNFSGPSASGIPAIVQHCRATLRRLHLSNGEIPSSDLSKIALACADIPVYLEGSIFDMPRLLPILQHVLHGLSVDQMGHSHPDGELYIPKNTKMKSLRELSCKYYDRGFPYQQAYRLLLFSRRVLRTLRLDINSTLDEGDKMAISGIFRLLSGPGPGVEELYFDAFELPPLRVFRGFISTNQLLRKVHFPGIFCTCGHLWHPGHDVQQGIMLISEFISALLAAPALEEVTVPCVFPSTLVPQKLKAIADVCVPAWVRGIRVSVCSYYYA